MSSHLEDLESLYWLLCFIIAGHSGPDLATCRLAPKLWPADIQLWQTPNAPAAAAAKEGHLRRVFKLTVQQCFEGLERLVRNLHAFFQARLQDTQTTIPVADAQKDFREFLGYFSQTIQELESPGDSQLPASAIVGFEPCGVFTDHPESLLLGIPKRDLDDQDASKSRRFKRFRLGCGGTLAMDEGGEAIDS